jgi:ribosomal protein S27AE
MRNPNCPNCNRILDTHGNGYWCPRCQIKFANNLAPLNSATAQRARENWEESIFLEKGEKMVASWEGNRETVEKTVIHGQYGRSVQDVKERKKGILALTNQKLLFLEAHGVFGKSYHQVLMIPLAKLGGISVGGTLIPFVSIADDTENHIFHIDGIGKNEFPAFRKTIMDCRQKRIDELEAEKRKERVQIVIDFSMLKDYMDRGGLVLQKTKCPECNAPLPIPTSGNQVVCEHCGSTIFAQDIFEKIKSLI